ncbi:hypothetical protein EG832_18920, partial [bacterium]|nr:hypothetical protein [bacterium]
MPGVKKKVGASEIESIVLNWRERCVSDLVKTMDELVKEKDREIASLKKQLEELSADLVSIHQSVH